MLDKNKLCKYAWKSANKNRHEIDFRIIHWNFTIKTANKLEELGNAQEQKENAKSVHIRHQK